jgi:pilus assembly protein CpaB
MAPVIDRPTVLKADKRVATTSGAGENKTLSWLLAALVVALVAVGLGRMLWKPAAPDTLTVVAAAHDLPPGYKLGYRDLHYLTIPKRYYSDKMIAAFPDVVGKTTAQFLPVGEPLTSDRLLTGSGGLSAAVNAGDRAVTLKLSEDALVDHAIGPGDKVDVLSTSTAKNGQKYTKTIVQNVTVLMAVPKEMLMVDRLKSGEQNKITLAVRPEDCEKLTQASEVGKIRLVLRNPAMHSQIVLSGADDRDLLPHEALRVEPPVIGSSNPTVPPPPTPEGATQASAQGLMPPPVQWIVDVFQGAKKESHAFPEQ